MHYNRTVNCAYSAVVAPSLTPDELQSVRIAARCSVVAPSLTPDELQ